MAFKDNLKRLRKAAGQTQEQLALACGWNGQSRVANYEKGLREPSLDELPVLAGALGTSVSELLGVTSPAPSDPSQTAGFDKAKLDEAIQFLEQLFHNYGRVFEPRNHTGLLAQVLLDLASPAPLNTVALTTKYGPQMVGGSNDERQSKAGGASEDDRSPTRRGAKKARAKAG